MPPFHRATRRRRVPTGINGKIKAIKLWLHRFLDYGSGQECPGSILFFVGGECFPDYRAEKGTEHWGYDEEPDL